MADQMSTPEQEAAWREIAFRPQEDIMAGGVAECDRHTRRLARARRVGFEPLLATVAALRATEERRRGELRDALTEVAECDRDLIACRAAIQIAAPVLEQLGGGPEAEALVRVISTDAARERSQSRDRELADLRARLARVGALLDHYDKSEDIPRADIHEAIGGDAPRPVAPGSGGERMTLAEIMATRKGEIVLREPGSNQLIRVMHHQQEGDKIKLTVESPTGAGAWMPDWPVYARGDSMGFRIAEGVH